MKASPFFSIITCTYNSAKYLQSNLDSVAQQSCRDFEHIFIDGQSEDETWSMIRAYQQKYPGQVLAKRCPAQGIAHAFNQGIQASRGRYLIHLNSDDSFFDDQVLHDVKNYLQKKPDLDWFYGQAQILEEDGQPLGIFPNRWIFKQAWGYLMKFFPFVPHQAVFIKRQVFEKYGNFDQSLHSKMDPDMWLRIRHLTKWEFMPRLICNYRLRADAESSAKKNQARGRADFRTVQHRYMNKFEQVIAEIINFFVHKYNKVIR